MIEIKLKNTYLIGEQDSVIISNGHKIYVNTSILHKLHQYLWYVNTQGYAVTNDINDNKVPVLLHRHIMCFPDACIDHKNLNKLDNRFSNLRCATRQQNNVNRPPKKGYKYKGVSLNKNKKNFRARISFHGKEIYIGSYKSEKDAAKAYNEVARVLYGEFAYMNKID